LKGIRREEPGPHQLRLELPAAHSASRMARQVVRQFALREGLNEDEVGTLELVTSELLSNAVDHGGGGSAMEESDLERDVRMTLFLGVDEHGWELRVSDQGGGDPAELARYIDNDALPDLEDERGRGFFLLVQMVDELKVGISADGKGLEILAAKRSAPLG
jgi:anti-sigma regulatory factor (Ser/Thr protein kinase)